MQKALTGSEDMVEELFDVVAESQRRGRELIDDPYPGWAESRAIAGVHRGEARQLLGLRPLPNAFAVERDHYALLSFDACDRALTDNATFSSSIYYEYFPAQRIGRSILHMGGAEHKRYRGIVQSSFTRQQAINWWQPSWITHIVDELIESFAGETTVDLSMKLAARLPMHTITRAFGLDDADAVGFRRDLLSSLSAERPPEERDAADERIKATLRNLIEARRREKGDDIISVLLSAEIIDDDGNPARLSEDEIFSFCRIVISAGGGTTWRQLGITLIALLSDPEQLEAVRADRKLIEAAVYESVRWNPTLPTIHRLVTADARLDGVDIPAGSIVDICLGAANRDPTRWTDPDRFDLRRPMQRNLGFAGGPHTCLGMFIAQTEMVTAINALFDRFPNMRFSPEHELPRIAGSAELRGITHLNVRLD